MIISGDIIAFLTFPGVIVHEIAHRFFCDIFKIPVYSVNYFKIGNSQAGEVIHEKITNNSPYIQSLVSIAPLIVNVFLGMLLTFPSVVSTYLHGDIDILSINNFVFIFWKITAWAGYSILFHAIPSDQDIKNTIDEEFFWPIPLMILMSFVSVLSAICNLEYVGCWFKILFAYAVSFVLPMLYYAFL